jgi:hypothetical protein
MTTNHDTMGTLFADNEVGIKRTVSRDLKIAAVKRKKLTPSQQTFNRLSKRIQQLQNAIQQDAAKLEAILKAYNAAIPALQRTVAATKIVLAKALGETTTKIKYGKRQAIDVRNVILTLCDEAFADIEPDEETQRFFNEWSQSSYQEELANQKDAMKQMLSQTVKDAFGLDIDFSDMGDTPEEMAQFAKRLQSQVIDNANTRDHRASGRKKTKKQIEKEERDRQREQQQLKSIRSLYLSLAKALHPDTETDPTKKTHKEELMKKVTTAYADKDLATLLKLELEWVADESHDLDTLPDEKLKLYIASLKEQIAALEAEHAAVVYNPRYMPISDIAILPENLARIAIEEMEKSCSQLNSYLTDMTAACSDPKRKKEIVGFVRDYTATASSDFEDSFADLFDDFMHLRT